MQSSEVILPWQWVVWLSKYQKTSIENFFQKFVKFFDKKIVHTNRKRENNCWMADKDYVLAYQNGNLPVEKNGPSLKCFNFDCE